MKKLIPLIIISLFIFGNTFAQYENTSGNKKADNAVVKRKPVTTNKWFAGGMIGGGFSQYNSYLELSPIVGYHLTPSFDVGTRITYIYQSYTDPFFIKHRNHIYGMGLFGRYKFLKFLMVHVEYSGLSTKWYDDNRYFVNSLYVGGGLYQSFGRGFSSLAILYDVFEDEHSPYNNPIIRIGFGINF
ncbi:MAG: hypothetical protein C0595_04250 [Marinilabiliales bacterium]|nr:MAG: hypothetical protein C0595_04250 [Marinilabiliales bacterium]